MVFGPERVSLADISDRFAESQHTVDLGKDLRFAQPEQIVIGIPEHVAWSVRTDVIQRTALVDEVLVDREPHFARRIAQRKVSYTSQSIEAVTRQGVSREVVPEKLRYL